MPDRYYLDRSPYKLSLCVDVFIILGNGSNMTYFRGALLFKGNP